MPWLCRLSGGFKPHSPLLRLRWLVVAPTVWAGFLVGALVVSGGWAGWMPVFDVVGFVDVPDSDGTFAQ